jgi:two-component system sensor histidine kinase BasS
MMPSLPLKMKGRALMSKCGELSKAFVRMDSRFGGIGLGLSIVSRITQLHQGHFYLQNRQGANGTRAWVELAKIQ